MEKLINRLRGQHGKRVGSLSHFGTVADQVLNRQGSSHPTRGATQDAVSTSRLRLPPNYTLDGDAESAYDALVDNTPIVFLTGRAGTGKTTFIEYVRQNLERNSVVLAPTGVAALNVGDRRSTRFSSFRPGFSIRPRSKIEAIP